MLFKCPSHVSRANPVSPPMITVVSFWERVVVTSPETLHCTAQTQLKRSVCLPEKLHPSVCCFSSHAGCPADYHHLRKSLSDLFISRRKASWMHSARSKSTKSSRLPSHKNKRCKPISGSVGVGGIRNNMLNCDNANVLMFVLRLPAPRSQFGVLAFWHLLISTKHKAPLMLIQFYRYSVINQSIGQIETLTQRCGQMKSESKKRKRAAGFLLWAAKCPYKIVLRIHPEVVEVFQSGPKWCNAISIHRAMLLKKQTNMTAIEVFYKQKGTEGHRSWALVPSIQLHF